MPSWITEEGEKQLYIEFITECFKSWVIHSGSLYTLDMEGKMAIDLIIENVFDYDYMVYQPLLDLVLEHGSHPDAVNSSNFTPFETLHFNQQSEYSESYEGPTRNKASIRDALVMPPRVLPLSCLVAHAVVEYGFPYQATGYLPHHLASFISIHDHERQIASFISHDFEDYNELGVNTELKVEFDVPL